MLHKLDAPVKPARDCLTLSVGEQCGRVFLNRKGDRSGKKNGGGNAQNKGKKREQNFLFHKILFLLTG